MSTRVHDYNVVGKLRWRVTPPNVNVATNISNTRNTNNNNNNRNNMAVFDAWLTEKLNSLNLDEEVYSDYLKSVLDEEEADSLHESLAEILSGVLEDGANEVADEIVQAWQKKNDNTMTAPVVEERLELNANLKALIEQQGQQENKTTIKKRNGDGDDYLKQKLLAQYGEVSDEEADGGGSSDDEGAPSDFVNVNAQAVADKGAAEREKAKQMHLEKKLLDKSNLEKDKLKKEDRKKEAQAKAAKGERRGGR